VARLRGGTSGNHGKVVFNLSKHLGIFLDANPIGQGYAGAACDLGAAKGKNYLEPDVCFVATGHAPADFSGAIPVAPDFVAEVWSPSDTTEKIHDKIVQYQAAGVRLIWSIYMLDKFIVIFRLNDPDTKFLNIKGELDGEDVIPGFRLSVSKLFE
jgi:Uma2 family endonuclease